MQFINQTEIQTLKIQRMLKDLDAAEGQATSLISVMIPSGGSISKTKQKLVCEEGTASQIKSRV
jgi:peptide chain release factor subunit 1